MTNDDFRLWVLSISFTRTKLQQTLNAYQALCVFYNQLEKLLTVPNKIAVLQS